MPEPRPQPRKLPKLPARLTSAPKVLSPRAVTGTVITGALGLAVIVVGKLKRGK